MDALEQPTLLRIGALLAWILLAIVAARRTIPAFAHVALLVPLVAISFIAHTQFVKWDSEKGGLKLDRLRLESFNVHDTYHYYIGTKYFSETGYHGLYEATVIADYEDEPDRFLRRAHIRDLTSNTELLLRKEVLKDYSRIKKLFSPERWKEFKADIAFFRARAPQHWHTQHIQIDHGYNGTPVTTALLGALGHQPFVDVETYLEAMKWMDLYLALLVAALVGGQLGWITSLTFLCFYWINPFNDFQFLGANYLRYNYMVALVLGVALYLNKRFVWSGIAFAVGTGLRVFPVFFVFALLAHQLLDRDRIARVWNRRHFYGAFAGTLLALFAATSMIESPDGRNVWLSSIERTRATSQILAINMVGLKSPFLMTGDQSLYRDWDQLGSALERTRAQDVFWRETLPEVFERRKTSYWAAAAALIALALFYLRRVSEAEALLAGIGFAFSLVLIAHYYYCLLAVIPLVFAGQLRVRLAFAALMLAVSLTGDPAFLGRDYDTLFSVLSLQVLLFLLFVVGFPLVRESEKADTAS
jgi:hypothetical protein